MALLDNDEERIKFTAEITGKVGFNGVNRFEDITVDWENADWQVKPYCIPPGSEIETIGNCIRYMIQEGAMASSKNYTIITNIEEAED